MASRKKPKKQPKKPNSELVRKLAAMIKQKVDEQLGPDATFEQRRDLEAELMRDVLWQREDDDLRESVSEADVVEVGGRRYARLSQRSSATYHGRWGPHTIEEALYRELGVHNGPTIKPLELCVGMIARRLTPDFARIAGELSADLNSRELENILRVVGMRPPSRSLLEKRVKLMSADIVEDVDMLEAASRAVEAIPPGVASISCGLDRFSVRMAEQLDADLAEAARPKRRLAEYVRKPPPPKEHHWRKAWVGSVTIHDAEGQELHTWRYAADAGEDVRKLAERVAADVAWILRSHPQLPVHVVQDAAPELRALPEALARVLPSDAKVRTLIDFEHLTSNYLDAVVDACEPEGDPFNMKSWYRGELLRDDGAIERIWRGLLERAKRLPGRDTTARTAVAAALSYIRHRKPLMRYASSYAANLPIGSGATESTCWTMQRRVKRPAQSWEVPGLRGTLALRALVISKRWRAVWATYAAVHRHEVTLAH
ncbi:hypothetical protein G6O69_17185 [Pseudenhygromyxa sp. WMMC2535]|uniref:hypothetical protein n=1 Tax=Pseudenhygromyxa sp. WMMC2535 TaxID=2712867 RepID=UPI001553FB2B|nr:hypothetical protein [Pseudenhygromyxa sp. WMMC2535]NVB38408.1 hypothetical protein [Pseudenhygromyxa sp. WMMC2535]NVB39580.1 hypothetical protein [Pseudenhygromyxa sp. WMMC2535]